MIPVKERLRRIRVGAKHLINKFAFSDVTTFVIRVATFACVAIIAWQMSSIAIMIRVAVTGGE